MTDDEGSIYSPERLRARKITAWVAIIATVLVVGGGSALVFWLL